MTRPQCPARMLLLRSRQPSVQTSQIAAGTCPTECIFCDIWQLATLVQTHAPAIIRSQSSPSSPKTRSPSLDAERSLRSIEQQLQVQRARLASILSICVVEGAEESEGLRIAHDRCLSTVTSLLDQLAILEQMMHFSFEQESPVSPMTPLQGSSSQRSLRRENRNCGLRDSYFGARRGSQMGVAM